MGATSQPPGSSVGAPFSQLLDDVTRGRESADQLLPLVYDELRRLARARLRGERAGQTLQPTALVHEAFLRLVGDHDPGWNGRGHFFGAAARAMRRILVDRARSKARLRRGGGQEPVALEDLRVEPHAAEAAPEDLLAIERALEKLEIEDARKGRLVELRYFAGLTCVETAAALDVSVGTVERDWRFVRAWLRTELVSQPPEPRRPTVDP